MFRFHNCRRLFLLFLIHAPIGLAHADGESPAFGHSSVLKVAVPRSGGQVIQSIIEPRPGCGLVKSGTGILVIAPELKVTGIITVEQGVLDLSQCKPAPGLRFNLAEGAGLKLPAGRAIPCDALFFSDEKQAAGTWGGKGSVAAKAADFESPCIAGGTLVVKDTGISARERWKRMKYGFFVHYVNDGNGHTTLNIDGSPTSAGADYIADSFDAAGFAEDIASMGVEYLIFTAWHSNFHPLFNSAAVERVPAHERPRIKTPKTDMLGRMVAAVRAKGVRVLFYSHPGQQLYWGEDWNRFMEDIYGEMMDRYDIDGFYVDENDPGGNSDRNINFHRIERAVRWRKPDAVMIQNFYGNLYAFDAGIGESGPAGPNFSPDIAWTMPNAYAQVISKTWSAQVLKVPTPTPAATRSPEGIFRATVLGAGSCVEGGGWAWAAGPYPGNGKWTDAATGQTKFVGRWEEGVLEAMQKAGAYIAPIAESIKNTYPSTSWRPQGSIGDLTWGVATRSTDEKIEYIHVLKPQAGDTLTLPPPDDGKSFANARLLPGGKAVKLAQTPAGIVLTLPTGERWNPLDTVIAMDVTGKGTFRSRNVRADDPSVIFGTREVFNDNATQPGGAGWIEYHGNWPGQARDGGEYNSDIHYTASDGDAFTIHFNGTGVMMVGNGLGVIDFSLDGKPVKRVNMNASGNRPHVVGIDLTGLPNGKHELRGVKVGGPYVQVDMFRVYNPAGGNWKRSGASNSIRTTDRNEDFVQIDFAGTAVQFIAPQGPDRGTIEVFLDGQSVRTINQYHGTRMMASPLVTLTNLPPGRHTLCLVKKRGGFMDVEAFRVFNP
ncbi:MAG: alpha-L-fucosidase [Verrucomicrobia bacterium]|nr:alpha-L-fucosidase [Verrucomicrobiota bacterium]